MVLSNAELRKSIRDGNLDISPLDESQIQPASIDLRLGSEFTVYTQRPDRPYGDIDSREENPTEDFGQTFKDRDSILIKPDKFYLGTTKEVIHLPPDMYGKIAGRSSIGRLGVEVHKTAGVVDPGYTGEITLEISSDMPNNVRLYEGQRVAQITIHRLDEAANPAYGEKVDSKYQGQSGPVESKIANDNDR